MESSSERPQQPAVQDSLAEAITDAERAANWTLKPNEKTLQRLQGKLNQHEGAITLRENRFITGLGYLGDQTTGQPTSEEYLMSFRDVAIRGFELHPSPYTGSRKYAFLRVDDQADPPQTYFMHFHDVVSMTGKDENLQEKIREDLFQQAKRCYIELADFVYLAPTLQAEKLDQLAESAGDLFMRHYAHALITVDAPIFYHAFLDDGNNKVEKVIYTEDDSDHLDRYPSGYVRTCAFIEQIVDPRSPNQGYGQLEINEPCIVLANEKGQPEYFIPISQLQDFVVFEDKEENGV